MQPEERAVLDLLQSWSPDVTGLLHRAGYFDLPEGTAKDEIASKIGFGRGTPLYKKLQASSLEKNWEVAKIVLDEQNLIELKQGAREVAKQLGLEFSEFDWDPIAQKYMKEHGFQLVKTLTQTDLKRIVPIMQRHFGLNEKTFAKRFRENYPCSEYRMRTIFRTEKFTAINGGAHGLALEAGATTKIWRHSHGPNPRKDHLAMDGEEQPIDKPFSNGKQHPGGDPNCGCRADYSFGGGGKAWRAKAQARMVGSRAPEPRQVAPMAEAPRKVAEFVPAKTREEAIANIESLLSRAAKQYPDAPLKYTDVDRTDIGKLKVNPDTDLKSLNQLHKNLLKLESDAAILRVHQEQVPRKQGLKLAGGKVSPTSTKASRASSTKTRIETHLNNWLFRSYSKSNAFNASSREFNL